MVRPHESRLPVLLLLVGAVVLTACTGTSASSAPASSSTSAGPRASATAPPQVAEDLPASIEAWRLQRDTRKNVRAIIVNVDGRTVFEKYYGTTPDVARDVESVTKSVISTLVGAALATGDLTSVDQTLSELLPAYAPTMTPAVAAVTLRQLLTMTAGVPDWTAETSPPTTDGADWVADILGAMTPTPDAKFIYSNPDAHLVSAILTQATGKSVLDFAREALFDPLGIDTTSAIEPVAVPSNYATYKAAQFAWPIDPQHINLGYSLLTLRPRDMLALGQLYLSNGLWKGRQVLPANWVADATSAQVKTFDTWESYGYLWWVTTADRATAYAAAGAGGQLIEVVPSRGLVVVATSEYDALNPTHEAEGPFDLTTFVNDVIAPGVSQ